MANLFRNTNYVLNDVYVRFYNNLQFAKTASRDLQDDFKTLQFATGQTLNYRFPVTISKLIQSRCSQPWYEIAYQPLMV